MKFLFYKLESMSDKQLKRFGIIVEYIIPAILIAILILLTVLTVI
jgi:hypothetical protein